MPFTDPRVLLIEDEFPIAGMLQRILEGFGCAVIWHANVADAKTAAAREKLHGAILDVNLRGEKVFPVCDVLRVRRVPFVFATAYEAASLPAEYKDSPIISKPFVRANVSMAVEYFRRIAHEGARA